MNEKEAIIKLKTCNDKAAFAFLYRSYWAKVYNFTRLYITSAVDVEEIVQEVFIKIWENRELWMKNKICRILIYHDAQPCFQPFP